MQRMVMLSDVFDVAERIELLAARQYELLASRFQNEEEAFDLFERLRCEELQHVERVRMARRRAAVRRRVVPGLDQLMGKLNPLLAEAEKLVAHIEGSQGDMPFDRAKWLMLHMEEKLAAAHAEAITAVVDEDMKQFFELLASQDKAHTQLLR